MGLKLVTIPLQPPKSQACANQPLPPLFDFEVGSPAAQARFERALEDSCEVLSIYVLDAGVAST